MGMVAFFQSYLFYLVTPMYILFFEFFELIIMVSPVQLQNCYC